MSSLRPQAIAGVSAGTENLLRTVYPSICSAGMGRLIGTLMNSIPVGIGPVKLSYLIFGPLLAGPALAGYFIVKIMGEKFVLTNRSISRWAFLGNRLLQKVELERVGAVSIDQLPGQEFYKAADIVLTSTDGNELLRLPGVPRAEIFRETILKAKQARVDVEASLARIRARQTA
jgi:hypothetical protein